MAKLFGFSPDFIRRIVAAIRAFERRGPDTVGAHVSGVQRLEQGFWAKITGETFHTSSNTYRFAWTEQRPTATGFENMPGGMSGTTSSGYAINTASRSVSGTPIVWMRFGWIRNSGTFTPVYRFAWTSGEQPWGRITTAATPGGTYNGVLLIAPTSNKPAGSTLVNSDFGTDGEAILILNAKEIGVATHTLTDAANTSDKICQLTYLRTNTTGVKVYMTDKIWFGCEDEEDADIDGGTA